MIVVWKIIIGKYWLLAEEIEGVMKLRDLLKHFEHLDLDTEIYLCSDLDDDNERLLSKNISIVNVLAITHPHFKNNLLVPDQTLNRIDSNVVEVIAIL